MVDGKPVVSAASKDCENLDLPDTGAITADAIKAAGIEIAMIRPTGESALREVRAEIAGIDIAIKEALQDKSPAR